MDNLDPLAHQDNEDLMVMKAERAAMAALVALDAQVQSEVGVQMDSQDDQDLRDTRDGEVAVARREVVEIPVLLETMEKMVP